MKLLLSLMLFIVSWSSGHAQSLTTQDTPRYNLTDDGSAYMVGFLAPHPNGQAVVVFPGGGYAQTTLDKYYVWATFFNRIGVSLFAVKYRMPNGDHTIPMTDAAKALQTVNDSAVAWHISPNGIGIMGTSAGGHLASTMATQAPLTIRPHFQILLSPVITMGRVGAHNGSVERFLGNEVTSDKARNQYSSELNVDSLTPPAIIFVSADDRTVPPTQNALAYYKAMIDARRPVSLHVYPDGGHNGTSIFTFRYHAAIASELSTWLEAMRQ